MLSWHGEWSANYNESNQNRTEQSKADRGSPRYSRCRCSYPSSCQQQSVGGMERVLVLNHQLMANEVKKGREIDRERGKKERDRGKKERGKKEGEGRDTRHTFTKPGD